MNLVHYLRLRGYKVCVRHFRWTASTLWDPPALRLLTKADKKARIFSVIAPRGGRTEVDLTFPDGRTVSETARCTMADGYDKKLGVKIALGRILKGVNKEIFT